VKEIGNPADGRGFAHRPALEKLFREDFCENWKKLRMAMLKAVEHYGYPWQEITIHLGLCYLSVSRIVNGERYLSRCKTLP
jgi:hypothetical protein